MNFSEDFIKNTVAPDIIKIISTYSNNQLESLLTDGLKKDGYSVYIMPSYMCHQLKEKSLVDIIAVDIIAYLRT